MLALRWLIGIASVVALAVFALILTVDKGFAAFRSGSGGDHPARDAAVLGIPLLLAAMLATVFLPQTRWLMHGVAVCVVIAMIGCATIVPTHPGEGSLYLGFFGLWLLYYGLTLWAR